MKKILTVSLFAIMAVSAANAEIASTKYVGDQITATAGTLSSLTTNKKGNLVEAINEIDLDIVNMNNDITTQMGNYALNDDLDALGQDLSEYKTENNAAVAAAKKAGDDAQSDLNSYKTSNNAAVAAAQKAGDDAQSDLDAYKIANEAAVADAKKAGTDASAALNAYKTEAASTFMDSDEVSTAIANAVTGETGALKDYVTTQALTKSQSDQDTALKAYADSAASTAKSGAETTAANALAAYKTENDTAVEAAKKAGDDAQADIDAYITSNDAALALKANSADVYTKTEAEAAFMNSSEVSSAIASAVTGENGALKDYVTTAALTKSQNDQNTAIETAYKAADTALETSLKSYADTAEADAIAAAATDATTKANAAEAAAKAASDSKGSAEQALADAKQFTTEQIEALGKLATVDTACATGVTDCALVIRSGEIKWEKVSY